MSRLLILFAALSACSGPSLECDESSMVSVFVDLDRDGFGDSAQQKLVCSIGPQMATVGGDCDDTRAAAFPGGFEECDGLDNDCDGAVDEGLREHTWYLDEDADGFGRPNRTATACSAPPGYVENDWDCHDDDPLSNPAADEFCDGKDNDCDGLIDDEDPSTVAESMPTWYKDNDVDGFGLVDQWLKQCSPPANGAWVQNAKDCDDANKLINPNAPEICNEIDDDCDGHVDDSDADIDPAALTTYWYDGDGDGFGDDSLSVLACDAPWFYVGQGGDCDDTAPHLKDASTGWWVADGDGDGFGGMGATPQGPSCTPPGAGFVHQYFATDCNDAAATVFPGANEICDGIDNDCDTLTDDADDALDLATATTFYADTDGDGFGDLTTPVKACVQPTDAAANAGDCDDTSATVHPSATEICNLGIDDDCDGLVDSADDSLDQSSLLTWYYDFDFDGWGDPTATILSCDQPQGYVINDRDCDDNDAAGPYVRPWIQDADGDGFGAGPLSAPSCAPPGADWIPGDLDIPLDCDDTRAGSHPGGNEICGDGIDQDCDGEDVVCPLNDTCAEASTDVPWTTGFHVIQGNLSNFTNALSPTNGNVCTAYSSPGPDGIAKVEIQAGEVLSATLTSDDDMQLYLSTACTSSLSTSNCLAGIDGIWGAGTESLYYFNASNSTKTAYLVADCTSGSCGNYNLTFDIAPKGSYYLPETCADAQGEVPLTTGAYAFGGELTAAMGNDLDLANHGYPCTNGFMTAGNDVFVPFEIQPGEFIDVWYYQWAGDASVYIVTDCFNGATCLDGEDAGNPEEAWYQNTSLNPMIVYVGFDCYSSYCSTFGARVIVE